MLSCSIESQSNAFQLPHLKLSNYFGQFFIPLGIWRTLFYPSSRGNIAIEPAWVIHFSAWRNENIALVALFKILRFGVQTLAVAPLKANIGEIWHTCTHKWSELWCRYVIGIMFAVSWILICTKATFTLLY